MRTAKLVTSFFLLTAGLFLIGAGPAKYSKETVTGPAQGNHELNCTVIRPWVSPPGPKQGPYPVIVWANGWCYNDVYGDSGECSGGYEPGLIEWALDGPYIVVAANQWSVQESDVLQCLQWIIDQNTDANSEYEGLVNTEKIGLSGHSQGGGAVIKAGDGEPNGFDITTVIAMNPYGPAWVNPGNQDGPLMLLGGTDDTTTPPDSYEAVWEAVQENDQGGINAVLNGGTHNSEAWGPSDEDAKDYDFGRYQIVTEWWWDFHLNDNARSGRTYNRD